MKSNEQAQDEIRMAGIRRLEDRMPTNDTKAERFHVSLPLVDELTSNRASLAATLEQAQAENSTLTNRIRQLEVEASTGGGKLGVIIQAVQPLQGHVAAGKTRAYMTGDHGR